MVFHGRVKERMIMLSGFAKLLFPIIKKVIISEASNKAAYWLLDEACDILIGKENTKHDEQFKKVVRDVAKRHR